MSARHWQIEVVDGLPCEFEETAVVLNAPSSSEVERCLLGVLRVAGISGVVTIQREAA